jgi:hypothetical protein
MVKIFLFFLDFGRGYLRVWLICNFQLPIFRQDYRIDKDGGLKDNQSQERQPRINADFKI